MFNPEELRDVLKELAQKSGAGELAAKIHAVFESKPEATTEGTEGNTGA